MKSCSEPKRRFNRFSARRLAESIQRDKIAPLGRTAVNCGRLPAVMYCVRPHTPLLFSERRPASNGRYDMHSCFCFMRRRSPSYARVNVSRLLVRTHPGLYFRFEVNALDLDLPDLPLLEPTDANHSDN